MIRLEVKEQCDAKKQHKTHCAPNQASGNRSEKVCGQNKRCRGVSFISVQAPADSNGYNQTPHQYRSPNHPRPIDTQQPKRQEEPNGPRHGSHHEWLLANISLTALQSENIRNRIGVLMMNEQFAGRPIGDRVSLGSTCPDCLLVCNKEPDQQAD